METEQLIAEIERRPGIYDSGCPQYQDRVAKWTLWCEVCEIMTPRWHQLDEDRKAARVKELQKRWKSLRDSFMKELKLQREMQRTGQTANRKKYVFFDQMTFLMPCLEARGVSRSAGGFVLREVDPYESETDSSKADRDGGDCGDQGGDQSADATDCQSDDAPVNLSTANGGGCSALSLGLGLGSGITIGLSGIGGVGGLSSLAGHSVLGSATAVTGVSTASQADDDRVPLMLTTSSTTTISSSSAATGNSYSTPGSTTGKYRSVAATGSATTAGAAAGAAQTGDWKRRRSGTPINPYDDDEDDPDGDRLFLLSLAPSLRTLRGAAKSALKIELAQLVHKTLYEPDDALADSMTESLAPVVSLAEGLAEGSPASSTQSECGSCGSAKCTCRNSRPAHGHGHGHSTNNLPTSVPITLPLPLPLPLPLTLPLSLPRGLRSPKRARHIGLDFSNFNGHTASKLHGV
ncbi:uncharacterized protein LOC113216861 [Frankliniella occidentalis]|uniref:Uncharacterized protein LOC113216861 n=1 Tax=Frankliniella occidentalis TaxID=133901 RepID=A0A6J1TGS8_FRAOC|nr:uncharacterized protein LOC113216861 [Frankliniella occidentalis]XP_052128523.1 uncharacterized protein LOC113216861 [Frankliniella occidentalis]